MISTGSLRAARSTTTIVVTSLTVLLVALFLISLSIGAVKISVGEICSMLFSKLALGETISDTKSLILLNIRLPRLVFTVLIGASLGSSGASLQGLLRNPLVEPGIIGVSSGAALGAILAMMVGKTADLAFAELFGIWFIPGFAFVGGVLATSITLKLGSANGRTHVAIFVLSGVAITALASAIIGLAIFYADEQQLRSYTFWTLGDLSVGTWQKNTVLAPVIITSTGWLIFKGKELNALALGEGEAFHSGVNVQQLKTVTILLCALSIGCSVAFAGIISFVGLVIPHIIRILFSSDNKLVLPASAIGGACLLMISDIFARTIVSPAELPIGIVTASIGAPFFIYLLTSAKKKNML